MANEEQHGSGLRVLVIEDTSLLRRMCENFLEGHGYGVAQAATAEQAMEIIEQEPIDIAILDLGLPDRDGLDLLAEIRSMEIALEVVVMTGKTSVDNAVRAMKLGACDFVTKPVDFEQLEQALRIATRSIKLEQENRSLRQQLSQSGRSGILGDAPATQQLISMVERVAPTDETVLLLGENGSGKDLVAQAIHRLSERGAEPFVAVNCGAIAESLIESELFGHRKGAFSGADNDRLGCFRQADGGTLFLDEIGEMPMAMQVKLLRALENREVTPVGADRAVPVNIRVVAATNRDLPEAIASSEFRQDLYYRLAVFPVPVPPLRERPGDVGLLARHFLTRLGGNQHLTAASLDLLERWSWPGNVRELQNVIRRAALMAGDEPIDVSHLPPEMQPAEPVVDPETGAISKPNRVAVQISETQVKTLEELEREAIIAALELHNGDRTPTAQALGIDRTTLYRKLKRLAAAGLLPEQFT